MKTAIVTGGAGGIGSAIVSKLCAEGYSVAIAYNSSEEKALALSSALISAGNDAFPVHADVSDPAQAQALIDAARKLNGRIDLLVNNAGFSVRGCFDEISDAEWDRVIGVNLSGAFYCCRAAVPVMLRQKTGRIVNISSMWGQTGASCEVAYSAAKAGLIGLTKALAKELAPSGIRVNCVAPGAVETPMMAGFTSEELAALSEEIPLGKLGKPEQIAEAVAFLASDKASYITGQVLGVNGGMVI